MGGAGVRSIDVGTDDYTFGKDTQTADDLDVEAFIDEVFKGIDATEALPMVDLPDLEEEKGTLRARNPPKKYADLQEDDTPPKKRKANSTEGKIQCTECEKFVKISYMARHVRLIHTNPKPKGLAATLGVAGSQEWLPLWV